VSLEPGLPRISITSPYGFLEDLGQTVILANTLFPCLLIFFAISHTKVDFQVQVVHQTSINSQGKIYHILLSNCSKPQ
jgi:hypothetical protein